MAPVYNGILAPSDPREPRQLKPARYPQRFKIPPPRGRRSWSLGEEEALQVCIVDWIRTVAPHCVVFAIRNEGKRSITEHQVAIEMGLYPGISDLCVLAPVKDHFEPHMVEVKTIKGAMSEKQEEFKLLCAKRGIHHAIVRSIEDTRQAFLFWNIKTRESSIL
jgi:hypothetical protein